MYLLVYCVCVCVFIVNLSDAHYTQQWAVHIEGGPQVADVVAKDHGFDNQGQIFEDHYHFTHSRVAKRSLTLDPERRARLAGDTRVRWAQQQIARKRVKRDVKFQDSDPKWPTMWYLNRGNGLDMNVVPAWLEGITGKGAVVTILDDGLEKNHPDLVQNYDPMASYDVNEHDADPTPRYDLIDSNRHGTRCAGEVAATSNNSVCALGVAHGAKVGGVRMLDGDVTDAVEARSLSLKPQHIDIYSASWGPDDDGKTVDGPGELATRAFIEGVTKGRNGKGSIFVWASGNGGRDFDNCNCDGYTNSIYSLSISSATENGEVPWYSEACSSTLATTYSSGKAGDRQIVTTDLRQACTSSHTGTSASAPLAAGICALALEANPNLTWRDMQHIVVRTARSQNLKALDWQTNGVGRNVSHSFGYGLMDAYAMVQMARNWVTVPQQHKCEITAPHMLRPIPAKSVIELELDVKECQGVTVLEHVQAKLTIFSQHRGDLNIQLKSPMGTNVTLLAHRKQDALREGFKHWPFMSVHSWGESPIGIWKLVIHNDGRLLSDVSELSEWELTLYGTHKLPQGELSEPTADDSAKENEPNDIDEMILEPWNTERKDDDDGDRDMESHSSACKKTNGQLCLECQIDYYNFYGKCIRSCPEGYYNITKTITRKPHAQAEEVSVEDSKIKTCVACHYTCKRCVGAIDYQCTECYPDATLFSYSNNELYCYSNNLLHLVDTKTWFIRMFIALVLLVVIVVSHFIWIVFRKMTKRKNDYDILKNIHDMERSVKTAVYSDSE